MTWLVERRGVLRAAIASRCGGAVGGGMQRGCAARRTASRWACRGACVADGGAQRDREATEEGEGEEER